MLNMDMSIEIASHKIISNAQNNWPVSEILKYLIPQAKWLYQKPQNKII